MHKLHNSYFVYFVIFYISIIYIFGILIYVINLFVVCIFCIYIYIYINGPFGGPFTDSRFQIPDSAMPVVALHAAPLKPHGALRRRGSSAIGLAKSLRKACGSVFGSVHRRVYGRLCGWLLLSKTPASVP